jgi:hypothetical protein
MSSIKDQSHRAQPAQSRHHPSSGTRNVNKQLEATVLCTVEYSTVDSTSSALLHLILKSNESQNWQQKVQKHPKL